MFNLAKAGYLDYKILFMALKYLKNETEYLPLKTAINGLNYLLKIYESSKIDEPSDEHYKKLFVSSKKFLKSTQNHQAFFMS